MMLMMMVMMMSMLSISLIDDDVDDAGNDGVDDGDVDRDSGGMPTGLVSFDAEIGDNVDCTFVNTKRGRILIDQVTIPGADPWIFDFNLTGGAFPPTQTRESSGVKQISDPDNQQYGVIIYQKRWDFVVARMVDENTLQLAWRPPSGGNPAK